MTALYIAQRRTKRNYENKNERKGCKEVMNWLKKPKPSSNPCSSSSFPSSPSSPVKLNGD
jgi:hypothetical protein